MAGQGAAGLCSPPRTVRGSQVFPHRLHLQTLPEAACQVRHPLHHLEEPPHRPAAQGAVQRCRRGPQGELAAGAHGPAFPALTAGPALPAHGALQTARGLSQTPGSAQTRGRLLAEATQRGGPLLPGRQTHWGTVLPRASRVWGAGRGCTELRALGARSPGSGRSVGGCWVPLALALRFEHLRRPGLGRPGGCWAPGSFTAGGCTALGHCVPSAWSRASGDVLGPAGLPGGSRRASRLQGLVCECCLRRRHLPVG